MEILYSVMVAIVIWTTYYYWTTFRSKQTTDRQTQINLDLDKASIKLTDKENLYPELRNRALSTTAEQLNLKLDNEKTNVYGVIMDWDIGSAVVTIVAFKTGDASMYLSSGQVYIGGYACENIRTAALAFVNEAQNYVPKAKITYYTAALGKRCVRFYLLTNKLTFTFQETVENLTDNNSEWRKLFDLGNNVVTEYRTIVDKQNK
jgi:hypothetical protein